MVGSFQLSPIKRACGNVQPDAGGLNLFYYIYMFTNVWKTTCGIHTIYQISALHTLCSSKVLLCIHENVSSKTRKNRLNRSRNISYSVLSTPLPRHNYEIDFDRSTMTINHEIQEQFIFFIDVFSAKFVWKMLGCLPIL